MSSEYLATVNSGVTFQIRRASRRTGGRSGIVISALCGLVLGLCWLLPPGIVIAAVAWILWTLILLLGTGVPISWVIVMFGLFVAGTMAIVQRWFTLNKVRHATEINRLLEIARSEKH